ncbi:MAG: secretin and TonB N-terminal domain-containing protein [Armatimonadota bacterium]|nr:secretin and TonB N-terminal domain-containing protein [bacterium]
MFHILKPWCSMKTTALSAAGVILAAMSIASSAVAANGIMLQIKDAPLKEVVMLLTQQSGTNIVIADDSKLDKKITASLNDVPLENALDYIVKGAGVSYRKTDDGTYIIGGVASEEPVVSLTDVAAALSPVELPAAGYASVRREESRMVVVKLIHSKPSELLRLIGWDGVNPMPNCEVAYPGNTNLTGNANDFSTPLSVIGNEGQLYDPYQSIRRQNNQPVVPTIDPASLDRGAGRSADQNAGAAQFPNSGSMRPSGYSTSGYGSRTGNTPPTPSNTSSSSSSSGSNNFLMPEGVDDVKPFDLDNSIIVKGTEDGIEQFKKVVRMLDVAPKQVQIKAEFVEVTTSDIRKFGIDWSLQRINESFDTVFNPEGNVVVGLTSGNLTAQLKAQLTSEVGRVINSPIISTINNQVAYISIADVIPYWQSVTVVSDSSTDTSYSVNYINIQSMLYVMPRVNGDGTITMTLMPQVADTGTIYTGPDDTQIPEQRTQSLTTQRRVANGETVVVGGFIRKSDSNSYKKIPILCDLPIVGSLFRTHSRTTEDRELLIFITPTIIGDAGTGTVGVSLVP